MNYLSFNKRTERLGLGHVLYLKYFHIYRNVLYAK